MTDHLRAEGHPFILDEDRAGVLLDYGLDSWRRFASDAGLGIYERRADGWQHIQCLLDEFKRQRMGISGLTTNFIQTALTPQIFAGCGSTGTAAASGVLRNFPGLPIFLDPDSFSIHNAPRQMMGVDELNKNKAFGFAQRAVDLIPTLPALFDQNGVGVNFQKQITALVEMTNRTNEALTDIGIKPVRPILYDSIDVTTVDGWKAKFEAHQVARSLGIPTVGAYDIGNRSQVFYFPYQNPNEPLLHGKIDADDITTLTPQELNMRLLPKFVGIPDVPLDYARNYIDRARKIISLKNGEPIPGMPQERVASSFFEAIVAEMTQKLIAEERPKIDRLMSIESSPGSLIDKLRLALLFATNLQTIKAAGLKDK